MLYCSYDQYAAAGGSMTEQSFTVLCARASRLIDGLTFGRAEPHAKACESCRSALTDACVQIVELLAAQQKAVKQQERLQQTLLERTAWLS